MMRGMGKERPKQGKRGGVRFCITPGKPESQVELTGLSANECQGWGGRAIQENERMIPGDRGMARREPECQEGISRSDNSGAWACKLDGESDGDPGAGVSGNNKPKPDRPGSRASVGRWPQEGETRAFARQREVAVRVDAPNRWQRPLGWRGPIGSEAGVG